MSDRLKTTSNISNEAVINDLTRDLELTMNLNDSGLDCHLDIKQSSSSNNQAEPTRDKKATEEKDSTGGKSNLFDLDENTDEEKDPSQDSDADSFSEESLKDAEVDLTDDDKAERQILAEELKKTGNEAFQVGDFERSIEKYSEGLRICPLQFAQQRSILYCNRSAAKMKLQQYKSAAKDCSKAIELDDKYLKAYFRRAQSLEATKEYDESLADYQKILELDPSHREAQKALVRLPPLIKERNENLKTEMLGKLKDLGNMILKPFGLSTSNFSMEENPETQGYNIKFNK